LSDTQRVLDQYQVRLSMNDRHENHATIDDRIATLKADCEAGRHKWKTWSANTVVDPLSFEPTGVSYLVDYIGGEPTFRGCVICGKKERLESKWVGA